VIMSNKLTFKERLTETIHNNLIFNCQVTLPIDEFHTCEQCQRRANAILLFLRFELGSISLEVK
jgi:hypothetical protein